MASRYDPLVSSHAPAPEQRAYFFDEGIQFECTQCGNCCTGAPGQVFVTSGEIKQLSGRVGEDVDTFISTRCRPIEEGYSLIENSAGDCVFLNDRKCSVHDIKPMQCATYPFWKHTLRNETNWKKACTDCEGIGRGRLYSREEILTIINHQGTAT